MEIIGFMEKYSYNNRNRQNVSIIKGDRSAKGVTDETARDGMSSKWRPDSG